VTFSTFKQRFFKHRQPIAWGLVVLWAAFIFFMSAHAAGDLPRYPERMSYLAHFMEYFVLAILLVGALDVPWRKSWIVAVAAMVIASLYGITDEFHQLFVAGRVCDALDWLVDTGGGTLGSLVGSWILMMYRMRRDERRRRGMPATGTHPSDD